MNSATKQSRGPVFGDVRLPLARQVFDSDDLYCRGWFYSENGISEIAVLVDGKKIGSATTGIERPDLKKAFPDREGIERSGFVFYGHVPLSEENHMLRFEIADSAGNTMVAKREFVIDRSVCRIDRVNLELTNHCNLSCRWCAGAGNRKKGFMDRTTFQTTLSQILSDRVAVREVHLYNGGESLLHPEFGQFLEYLGSLKDRPATVLVTNGTLLTETLSDAILESGGIDTIQFSIDGGTKEKYEWLRRKAVWEDTLNRIGGFLDRNRGRVKTGLITIDMGVPFSDEFRQLRDRVDSFNFRPPHDYTGQEKLDDYPAEKSANPHPCWHIRNNLVILWNGDVTPCCADFHGRGVFGNIHTSHLADLWNGARLALLRRQEAGDKHSLVLCSNCSIG